MAGGRENTKKENESLKKTAIEVSSFVMINGLWEDTETLSEDIRKKLAVKLKSEYLNSLFYGEAVFVPKDSGEK